MGASSNRDSIIQEQIKNYYIFQKKIELILKKGYNYLFGKNNSINEIEEIYIIDFDWIKKWKDLSGYEIAKDSFDKLDSKNEKKLLKNMDIILGNLRKAGAIKYFTQPFGNNEKEYNRFIYQSIIDINNFECLVNKKVYKLFKEIVPSDLFKSQKEAKKIEGIITEKTIYLLIKEHFTVKILYHGLLENEIKLIQLTCNCLLLKNGEKLDKESKEAFLELKDFLLTSDPEYVIDFFNDGAIGFLQSRIIRLENGLSISLRNENLTQKYLEKEKKNKKYKF